MRAASASDMVLPFLNRDNWCCTSTDGMADGESDQVRKSYIRPSLAELSRGESDGFVSRLTSRQ